MTTTNATPPSDSPVQVRLEDALSLRVGRLRARRDRPDRPDSERIAARYEQASDILRRIRALSLKKGTDEIAIEDAEKELQSLLNYWCDTQNLPGSAHTIRLQARRDEVRFTLALFNRLLLDDS